MNSGIDYYYREQEIIRLRKAVKIYADLVTRAQAMDTTQSQNIEYLQKVTSRYQQYRRELATITVKTGIKIYGDVSLVDIYSGFEDIE